MPKITLEEIQEICREQHKTSNYCSGCPLDEHNDCIMLYVSPRCYNLEYLEQKIKEWREKNVVPKN